MLYEYIRKLCLAVQVKEFIFTIRLSMSFTHWATLCVLYVIFPTKTVVMCRVLATMSMLKAEGFVINETIHDMDCDHL